MSTNGKVSPAEPPPPPPEGRSLIFDIPIALAQPAEMLMRVTGWVGRGGLPRRVMYVNAHVLNRSQESARLRAALERADLVYCDGYGVRLAAKALEVEIPHRMTGADWIWGLASLCEAGGHSIYLLGCDPGIAAEAARRLRRQYPRLKVSGSHHGYFEIGSPHDERVIEDINARRPDIVLVGMGTPKQEEWVERSADRLDVSVCWTVGALFDYVSGRVPRAPGWLADNGLEWIFRLVIEPQRMWRRYLLGNPVFLSRVLRQARGKRRARLIRAAVSLLAFVAVGYLANRVKLAEAIHAHDARDAIYPALRVALAAAGLFAVTGWGVVRLALPPALHRHELVWVLPVGACVSALGLTLLGFAFVPLDVSLGVMIAGGLAVGLVAVRRRAHQLVPRAIGATVWPLYVAALIGAFVLVPLWHGGYPTVIGDGSDAHLAAGTAQFLQSHQPLARAATEPVNEVPLVWRSKTPIYYALAAVSTLSGVPTWEALSPMMAFVLGLALLGFFLAARELLGSNMLGAVAGMALVGLDRMVVHTAVHPYYNQLWGFMAMAPAVVLGWRVVDDRGRARTRGTLGLFLLFFAVGAFAYPLAAPIPLIAVSVAYWRAARDRRRAGAGEDPMPPLLSSLRRRTEGRSRAVRALVAVLLLVPVVGVVEKLGTGFAVVFDPSRSLYPWAGDVADYFPTREFLSLGSDRLLWFALPLMAVGIAIALRRAARPVAWSVVVLLAVAAAGSYWFHARTSGQYFDFKLLAYLGPVAVLTAAVGASRVPVLGWLALAAFGLTAFQGADTELAHTGNQLSPDVRAVSRVAALIGPGRSVRLDMDPPLQIWVAYFLHDEPLCSQRPLFGTSYPHVAVSRKADYILADHFTFRPFDAFGPPVATVGQFVLYRERPDVPGRDRCSTTRVQTVSGLAAA